MGSELVSDSNPDTRRRDTNIAPPFLYTKIFEEAFPFYLSIGMTYEQYWCEDSTLTIHYRKAYKLKLEQMNYQSWLQGLYYYEALCDVSPVLHAFAKNAKPIPYASEPYPMSKEDYEKKTKREQEERLKIFRETLIAMSENTKKEV